MNWPSLVPKACCHTPVVVSFVDGVDVDGVEQVVKQWSGNCNYSEQQKQTLDAERRLIVLEATALFAGDIAPGQVEISGFVVVNGIRREIYRASRARNPDGTVNYTRLDLM